MRVIDGDRDYLLKKEDFIKLYNDRSFTVKDIRRELDLSLQEFRLLRNRCNEEGSITLRPSGRSRKPKRKPKFYSVAYHGLAKETYQICRKDVYYCNCDSVREAEMIVEKLKECGWDKSQVQTIKKEVKELIKNE